MIWRIFKKDLRLLWPFVLIVAGVHVVNAVAWFLLGYFVEPLALRQLAQFIMLGVVLAMGVLIAMAVHQDVVPGDRQDWLTRPIPRRDLFAAKLLFLLIAVQSPMLVVDIVQCLAMGFTTSEALSAGLSRGLYMLFRLNLPVLALAAMTSTIVEGLMVAVAIGVGFAIALGQVRVAMALPFANMSSGSTMIDLWTVLASVAAFVVIGLQYSRRATHLSRTVTLGVLLVIPLTALIPWRAAFAFQQWTSRDPVAAKPVAIAFAPELGKKAVEAGAPGHGDAIWLPMRVSGLVSNAIILDDRTEIRIIDRQGIVLFRGPTIGAPQPGVASVDDFPVRTTVGGVVETYQRIALPRKIYDALRNKPVRIELDYSLSLFRAQAIDTIPALGGYKRVANFGLCRTEMDNDGDDVVLGCIKTGSDVACGNFVLENLNEGRKNPSRGFCLRYYVPYNASGLPDAMTRMKVELPFRDPQGLAKYPVDRLQLVDARIALKIYEPVAHFTRHLVIPETSLGDWEEAATPAPSR